MLGLLKFFSPELKEIKGKTTKEMEEVGERVRLADYVPWLFYDEETETFYNNDDTIGFGFECVPANFLGKASADPLRTLLLNEWPEGSLIQFQLFADPHIDDFLRYFAQDKKRIKYPRIGELLKKKCKITDDDIYEALIRQQDTKKPLGELLKETGKVKDEDIEASLGFQTRLARESVLSFIHLFKAFSEFGIPFPDGSFPVRSFRLFVWAKLPRKAIETGKCRLEDQKSILREALAGAGFGPRVAGPDVLVELASSVLGKRIEKHTPLRPLNEQVLTAETELFVDGKRIKVIDGGEPYKEIGIMTINAFPRHVELMQTNHIVGGWKGPLDDANQIGCPFLYCVNLIPAPEAPSSISRKYNFIATQTSALASMAGELNRMKDEYYELTDKASRKIPFWHVTPILVLYSRDPKALQDNMVRARRIYESVGYSMQEESYLLNPLLIAFLPMAFDVGSTKRLARHHTAPATSIVPILPVQADSQVISYGGMMFLGRKGQIVHFNPFHKSFDNRNIVVAGGMGSGKSFFMNYFCFIVWLMGGKIRIMDLGDSYGGLCHLLQGKNIRFSKEENISLNPISFAINEKMDEEDRKKALSMIVAILAQMCYAESETEKPSETEIKLLTMAVDYVLETKGVEKGGIDDIRFYLSRFPESAHEINQDVDYICEHDKTCTDITSIARRLALHITPFCSNGRWGRYFKGKANLDLSSDDFVIFELNEISGDKGLLRVVNLCLMNAISFEMYQTERSIPKLFLLEEIGIVLQGAEKAVLEVVNEAARRARKHGGLLGTVSQSPIDYSKDRLGAVGEVLISNAAFRVFLPSPDYEKAVREHILDYDEFGLTLLKGMRGRKPYYSEVFFEVVGSAGNYGVYRLTVNSFLYMLFTTHPDEVPRRNALWKKYGDLLRAVREMADERNRKMGFDRILQQINREDLEKLL